MPLWASYLIKAYSWRLILSEGGVLDWILKPLGLSRSGLRRHRDLADLHLPLAAVHDPADLRRPRADPELAARGIGGSRRARLDDVPQGHPADVDPGRRRRLDLHVRADARRLHRARARLDDPVHRQRHRHQRRPGPAVRGRLLARAARHHPRATCSSPGASAPSRRSDGRRSAWARSACGWRPGIVLVFIYVPLALVVIYAFNESGTSAWPPSGFTSKWVGEALANTGLQQAFLTSIAVRARRDRRRHGPRARSPRWPCRATRSSGERRSRSC